MNHYSQVIATARDAFNRNITRSLNFRIDQIKALYRLFDENGDDLVEAVQSDLKKPFAEAYLAELEACKTEIKSTLSKIHKWVQPETTETIVVRLVGKTFIYPEPYGVVLVIGTWNYPIILVALPFLGAIAAGNCAIIKPSEKSPATSKLLSHLVPKYLDSECFHVVTGGASETMELLKERFDYIFYTGSSAVGQQIRASSNKYLTPVTLELGGKSPVYVDDDVDIELACRRILWGKMLNLGQTCIAPDYILCSKETQTRVIEAAKKVIFQFFGKDPQQSPDLARIIDQKHFERVLKYLNCGKVAVGGAYDATDRYIAPTILCDVKLTDSIMVEEIFGPVLPIINVSSPEEAIEFVNKMEKPLTLYLFSTNKHIIDKFLMFTSSGSMCVNDTMVHLSVNTLPFGGVGMSGMGRYRGKATFETFSNKKSVLVRSFNCIGEFFGKSRYPPYTAGKLRVLKKLLGVQTYMLPSFVPYVLAFLVGMFVMICIQQLFTVSNEDIRSSSQLMNITINRYPSLSQ